MDFKQLYTRCVDTVLTVDPSQRLRLTMSLGVALTYVVYATILLVQIAIGIAPKGPTLVIIGLEMLASAVFYAVIRSGLNLRLRTDPSLTLAQLVVGNLFTMAAYAVVGPVAPAVLMVVATQCVYMVFSMPPKVVMRLVFGVLVTLAITMVICHVVDPARYPVASQSMVFAYACLVIPVIGRMAHRVTHMRERMQEQRRDLQQALEKVRTLAMRDELTQVYNRRHLGELLAKEAAVHRRAGRPLSLALLDIDLFKSINDRFGHKGGDEVLRCFAAIAGESLRETDLLGRWGGEEFVVVFPDTEPVQAMEALQRLRLQLLDRVPAAPVPDVRISFSAGVARLGEAETPEAAIERADLAMYEAKSRGRDRCVNAETAETEPVAA